MKCNLDTNKAYKLRRILNDCEYLLKSDLETYCELCTIMDRYEDTIEYLNQLDLPNTPNQCNATDFIIWVNYADLIIACLKALNKRFVIPNNTTFFRDDNIKINAKLKDKLSQFFHIKQNNDDDYFRFIRAILLSHSLKIDAHKHFTQNLNAYSPLVRWNNTHDAIEITYYVADYKMKTQTITVKVQDAFNYLENRCGYLDYIFKYIEIENEKEKEKLKASYKEDFCSLPENRLEKIDFIRKIHLKNGNIDVKNNADIVTYRLEQIEKCLSFNFNSINNTKIKCFCDIVDYAIDDLIEYLKEQKEAFLLDDLLSCCSYRNVNSRFNGNEYEINKIVSELDKEAQTNCFWFSSCYDKIKSIVNQYIFVDDTMNDQEKALLCMVAMVFDNILFSQKIKDMYPNELIKKVAQLYEV